MSDVKEKENRTAPPRAPAFFRTLDFENPLVERLAVRCVRLIKYRTAAFAPPDGICLSRISVPSRDGGRVPCFLFRPAGASGRLPLLFYCHGGGFLMPVRRIMLQAAAEYAGELRCAVLIPEYRLAWDRPFPIPFYDCADALNHAAERAGELGLDAGRIVIYGDSSGGCLAAALTMMCRDGRGPALRGQLLIYPVTDSSMDYPSMREYGDAVWSAENNRHMWNIYLRNGDCGLPGYAVPISNPDLSRLPPAYVEPQELDCLRDQAIAYAEKLAGAGVPVELNVIKGSFHAFDADAGSPAARAAQRRRRAAISRMFGE